MCYLLTIISKASCSAHAVTERLRDLENRSRALLNGRDFLGLGICAELPAAVGSQHKKDKDLLEYPEKAVGGSGGWGSSAVRKG